jgi:hypothetical protein
VERILFLDIDGVLIPRRMYFVPREGELVTQFCPSVVGMINAIVKETGCSLVVHSSWVRTSLVVPCVKEHMISQGIEADAFHEDWKVKYAFTGTRWDAIYDWIYSYHNNVDFFILDDEFSPFDMPELIQTKFDDGMTFEHYKRIVDTWTN